MKKKNIYAGIDTVGVGFIVGPMVAEVVVLPSNHGINELPVDYYNHFEKYFR